MATTTNDGSGWTNVSGTGFASTANAYDGSATTYATVTTSTAGDHVGDVTGYDFGSVVPSDATLNSVVVNVQQYVSNAARWDPPTIQAYDGTTAIGTASTLTERTSAGNENVTLSSVTLAQVRSTNFKLRFTAKKAGTTSAIQYFGWANVTVTYTPAAQALTAASISDGFVVGATSLSQTVPAQSLTAASIADGFTVGATSLAVSARNLTAASIVDGFTVGATSLSQTIPAQALTAGSIADGFTVGATSLSQTIPAQNLTSASIVDGITFGPDPELDTAGSPHYLGTAGITITPTVGATSLTATVALTGASIVDGFTVGATSLSQTGSIPQALTTTGITPTPTVGTPLLTIPFTQAATAGSITGTIVIGSPYLEPVPNTARSSVPRTRPDADAPVLEAVGTATRDRATATLEP